MRERVRGKSPLIGGLVVLLAAVLGLPPVVASDGGDGEKRFTLEGEVRTRWDSVSNYSDLQDQQGSDPTLDDDFNFWPYRVRIAAVGHLADNVNARLELQNNGYFGNDEPLETLGGPAFFDYRDIDDSEVDLYQGIIKASELFGSQWSLSVGRMEHTLGNELHLGDADFYDGQTFDGLRLTGDYEKLDVDVFYYMINADQFDGSAVSPFFIPPGFGDNSDDLSGVSVNFGIGENLGYFEPYWLLSRFGDTSLGGGNVNTLGVLYKRAFDPDGDNRFDWSAEFAMQNGELGPDGPTQVDTGGTIAEGWLGYNLGQNMRHRVHVGALMASGDDDTTDTDADQWFSLFTDNHAHNRLGDLDLEGGLNVVSALTGGVSNVTDLNVGYELWFGEDQAHQFSASIHDLALSEETQVGLTEDEIGLEIDLGYGYRYSENLGFSAGIGQLSAGKALDALAQGAYGEDSDDITRAWWQLQLLF